MSKRKYLKYYKFLRAVKTLFAAISLTFISLAEAREKNPRECSRYDRLKRKATVSIKLLKRKAQRSLRANIVNLESGSYVRAGANHFGSLWTRDFVYSIPGLLTLGKDGEKAVRDHLSKLFNNTREDGLVPRLFDIEGTNGRTGSERRIISYMLDGRSPFALRFANLFERITPLEVEWNTIDNPELIIEREEALRLSDTPERPLIPEYLGEHKTPAFDSNILAILGALNYVDQTGDFDWFRRHKEQILKVYSFYHDKITRNGLIKQPKFSDWQDSVSRKGYSFYINFLYWKVGDELLKHKGLYGGLLEEYEIYHERMANIKFRLWEEFFNKKHGIFKSHRNLRLRKRFTLEDQLFAIQTPGFYRGVTISINSDLVLSEEKLRRFHYEKLKESKLWKGSNYTHYEFDLPGLPTQGNYFFWDRSFYTNMSGIRRYHDKFIWSWLIGQSAKIASIMDGADKGREILENFASFGVGENPHIAEIYTIGCKRLDESITGLFGIRPTEDRYLYKSEAPFAWGSAKLLEGINAVEALN